MHDLTGAPRIAVLWKVQLTDDWTMCLRMVSDNYTWFIRKIFHAIDCRLVINPSDHPNHKLKQQKFHPISRTVYHTNFNAISTFN